MPIRYGAHANDPIWEAPETPRGAGDKALWEMAEEVINNNIDKGWRHCDLDETRTFGDEMMLVTTEVGEAFDAFRKTGMDEFTHEVGTGGRDWETLGKPDDVGSELADVLIRLIDTAYWRGVDLQAEYERKMAYNRTRPYRHGGRAL
jgi:NTP pyrophosphatase (non-canonical NTP hydrolase)